MIYPPKAGDPRTVRCEECAGTGEVEDEDHPGSGTLVCSDCDGTGEIEVEDE